jgi:hypothetical protein
MLTCPFKIPTGKVKPLECTSDCALYDQIKKCCTIVTIAKRLNEISENIDGIDCLG